MLSEQQLHEFRVKIDQLIQSTNRTKVSAESTLALRSLQMAKGWLGKLIGAMFKTPTPYPVVDSANKIVNLEDTSYEELDNVRHPGVEPDRVRDVHYAEKFKAFLDQRLVNANEFRSKIQTIVDAMFPFIEQLSSNGIGVDELKYSLQHLQEAKMWFGYEINAIKPK